MTDPEIFQALILANRRLERIDPPPGLEAQILLIYDAWAANEPMAEHVRKLMEMIK